MPAQKISKIATFLIEYHAMNNVLTPAQIKEWYDSIDPEQDLRDLEAEFGFVRVLYKSWRRNGRLILTMEADSSETLLRAFDFIADPDSDGNYPIEMNGIDALVVGELLEEIE